MKAPTLSRVRAMIAKANGLSLQSLKVSWVQRCEPVTYPTGLRGLHGKVRAEAPGFRSKELWVMVDPSGILIK